MQKYDAGRAAEQGLSSAWWSAKTSDDLNQDVQGLKSCIVFQLCTFFTFLHNIMNEQAQDTKPIIFTNLQ